MRRDMRKPRKGGGMGLREGLDEEVAPKERKEADQVYHLAERISLRGNSTCKDPGVELCLV